jgi:hypothetical protein
VNATTSAAAASDITHTSAALDAQADRSEAPSAAAPSSRSASTLPAGRGAGAARTCSQ